jgi:hypothetical protein
VTSTQARGPDLRLVALVSLIAIAIIVWRTMATRAGAPLFGDTDDAMRVVVVRDFLGGQGWYDHVNHRLNAPFGAEIHWSRLIDVPIAMLLALFTPLLGGANAIVAVGYVWPMLLLAVLLWLSARLAFTLVGPEGVLPALVLPVLSPVITAEFAPGRVDHHGVVILLTVALIWTGVEAIRRPRFAIAGGVLAATALAVAIEALPAVAAAILVAGFTWVFEPARVRTMRFFGWSFAGASVIHLALYREPARWLETACDVLSPVYVLVALGVAAAFTIAPLASGFRAWWQRLVVLGMLGAAAMGVVAALYPQCLAGPYVAMDPWLQENWLASINEARPWWLSVWDLPAYSIAVGVPVLLALLAVLWRLWRVPHKRAEWAAVLLFIVALGGVMLLQIRGSRLAIVPTFPAAAWLIVAARHRYLAQPRLLPILGLVASWLAFAGIVLSVVTTVIVNASPGRAQVVSAARSSKEPCLVPAAFADLAVLPPERLMTPIDLGAHALLYTPHQVVAAPYHRNEAGVRDAFRFFNDPIDTVRPMLAERGIGLVVLCPPMAEVQGLASRAPDSFAALYAENALPAWLEDVSLPDSPLQVFAVLPTAQ